MKEPSILAALIGAAWLGVNVPATRRVLASGETAMRKALFVAGVWLIPFFGALAVKDVGRAPRTARSNVLQEAAPAEVALPDGTRWAMEPLLRRPHGLPLLSWTGDVHAPTGTAPEAVCRAWLLHLRESLGHDTWLLETEHAIVVSSLDETEAAALARYVATTRTRVQRVLPTVAAFPPEQKSVVLVMDDDDSYYQYVAGYYEKGGEFAFSGGMFLPAACPHFVVKRADLQAVEPVVAHELTHSALSHLDLPLWIDEGLAVNTEHRLTRVVAGEHTPQELHAKHLAFWSPERIQEFWSGRSFSRQDDGQLLSYELARILVREMAADWDGFARFLRDADAADGGDAAARSVLGIDLGASVCAMFGQDDPTGWRPDPVRWSAGA
jgi:hypothetical protein